MPVIEIIVGLASSANAWTVLLLNIVFGDRRPFSRQVTLIFGRRILRLRLFARLSHFNCMFSHILTNDASGGIECNVMYRYIHPRQGSSIRML